MSDQPAAQLLASYFRRWSNIEEAKQNLAEDSKELMNELKGVGFDAKATRAVFRDKRLELTADAAQQSKREEDEALYDLYRAALDEGLQSPPARPAHARVEKIEEFPPSPTVLPVASDAVTSPAASVQAETASSSVAVSASFIKPNKPLRPHCLRPDVCGGVGARHCHSCIQAMGEAA